MDIKANVHGIITLKKQDNIEIVDEFYRWAQGITESNFHAILFTLIQKADRGNKFRLSQGFPLEVELCRNYSEVPGWWEEFLPAYQASRGAKNGKSKDN